MLEKIISGGQSGADRAALDFALARGLAHGGWCPRGRLAEDGAIDVRYQLVETPSAEFAQRTEWNVRDSDGTVIFTIAARLAGGSLQTAEFARRCQKPCLHLAREREGDRAAAKLLGFLTGHRIRTLNVAGPRESEAPQVGKYVRETLRKLETCPGRGVW
ncbi:MAG: putative molybdenum carrier protein [Verrucomicrobiota bacterium]|jgi:hypothetical protein